MRPLDRVLGLTSFGRLSQARYNISNGNPSLGRSLMGDPFQISRRPAIDTVMEKCSTSSVPEPSGASIRPTNLATANSPVGSKTTMVFVPDSWQGREGSGAGLS